MPISAAKTAGGETLEAHSSDNERRFPLSGDAATVSDIPRQNRLLPRPAVTLAILDLFLMSGLVASFIFAIRDRLGFSTALETTSAVTCIVLASMILAYGTGCYRNDSLLDFSTATTRLAVGLGVGVLFLVPLIHFGLGFVFDAPAFLSFSRGLTIVLIGVGVGLCGGMLGRILLMGMARRQWFERTVLVIGTGTRARHLRDILTRADRRLTKVHFLPEELLGAMPRIRSDAENLGLTPCLDQVVLALENPNSLHFDTLLPWKTNGIPILDFNTFLERETGRLDLAWTEPDWLLYSEGFHFGYLDSVLKRALDLGISSCLLLLTLPALLVVVAAIVLDDFGPVLYRQERVTYRGRRFLMLKFRTMRGDAEENGPRWAVEKDPRVTRVGRILRRTRIDEIPQLINVLRGDMSLVGPRPERPTFVEDLSSRIRLYPLRHSVKAGLTGWAQINYPYGASVQDAERKLEYDLYYLKHFSLLRDMAIMLQTLRILLFAKGGR